MHHRRQRVHRLPRRPAGRRKRVCASPAVAQRPPPRAARSRRARVPRRCPQRSRPGPLSGRRRRPAARRRRQHPLSAQRENIFTSNVEGTKLILRAAKKAGVRRIVHTGSTAALGCAGRGKRNNEATPCNLWNASSDYERSKYLGEKTALELFAQEDIPVLIAQPAAAVGPGDAKPTYTGKLILDYLNRALPGYFDTRHNYVDVRSVAAGHLLALEKGEPGQRYLLCGDDNLLLSEYFALLRELTGVPPPRLKLPLLAVFPLAYACQALFHLTGRDPFIRVSTAKRAWCNLYYSNQKAKDQLGYAPRPLKDALRDEIEWFLRNGMLDPAKVKLIG